jgi:hypothetical protein
MPPPAEVEEVGEGRSLQEIVIAGHVFIDEPLMRQLQDLAYQLWMASPIGIAIFLGLSKLAPSRRAVLLLFSVASTIGLFTGVGGYAAFAVFQAVLNIGCAFTLTPCLNATLGSNGILFLILFYVAMVGSCLCWGVPKVFRDLCRSFTLVLGSVSPPATPREALPTPREPTPLPTPEPTPRIKQVQALFASFDSSGDGLISVQELESAMRRLNVIPDREQLEKMIGEVDYDQSGFLSFDEFVTVLEHFRAQPASADGSFVASKHSLMTSGTGGSMGFWSVLGDWAADVENAELPERRTRDCSSQTVWRRHEYLKKKTESMQDEIPEKKRESSNDRASISAPMMITNAAPTRHAARAASMATQTFLSGPSPYSGANPPRSWLPPAVKTREMACQSDRPAKKVVQQSTALVVAKTTCEVGTQSFLPTVQKPSRYMKSTAALAIKDEVRALVVSEDRPQTSAPKVASKDTGCGPGPWVWKETDRVAASATGGGAPSPPLLALVRTPLRDETASPRLPKISLVFYNARTSFKTKQSTPRRLTRSAAWGPSVDEIEPTNHFAPLPGSVHFYVRLRTKERPTLDGPGWKKPLQVAHGYASKRSLIWPTAALDLDRIIGYEPHINLHLARVLELEVCIPGDHKGINPTLETHYHNLNLETVRNRLVLEDGSTRISIPLLTRPRAGLEASIAGLRPGAPPANATESLLSPTSMQALLPPEDVTLALPSPATLPALTTHLNSPFQSPMMNDGVTPIGELVPRSSSPFLPKQQQQQQQQQQQSPPQPVEGHSSSSPPPVVPPLLFNLPKGEGEPPQPPNIYSRGLPSSSQAAVPDAKPPSALIRLEWDDTSLGACRVAIRFADDEDE